LWLENGVCSTYINGQTYSFHSPQTVNMPTTLFFSSSNHLKGSIRDQEAGNSFDIETTSSRWGDRKVTTIVPTGKDNLKTPGGEINWERPTFSIGDRTRDWGDLKLTTAGSKR
jgi:hypothetical protein